MKRNLAVLGTGAIGSSIGADLSKAGENVLLVDQWPAHVEAMKSNGLHITMPDEEFRTPVRAAHLCDLCAIKPQFDIVFLAAKSFDTIWMVDFIKPYLKEDGVLVSMQNSLNDEWIAPIIGEKRDIGCAMELSAEVFEPGVVTRDTDPAHTWFAIGHLDGSITPLIEEVAQILGVVGTVEISTNIWGAKWSKLLMNSMTSGMSALLGVKGGVLVQNPEIYDILIALGKESAQVATTLGYRLEPLLGLKQEDMSGSIDDFLKKSVLTLISKIDKGKGSKSMILADHLKGRLSEVDYISGFIVRKAIEANVPTPWNEAVTFVNKQIEQGILEPSLSNLDILIKSYKEASRKS